MKLRRTSRLLVVPLVVLFLAMMSGVAQAATWTTIDTDSISRSTPSNRAYSSGTFTWQYDSSSSGNYDQLAKFSAKLVLQGPANGCARLKILTYVGGKWTNDGENLEKRFPESKTTNFGYYTYCSASGSGTSSTFSGSDIQDRSIWDIGRFKKADITVCWTANRATPPGGDCYAFTVHPWDTAS